MCETLSLLLHKLWKRKRDRVSMELLHLSLNYVSEFIILIKVFTMKLSLQIEARWWHVDIVKLKNMYVLFHDSKNTSISKIWIVQFIRMCLLTLEDEEFIKKDMIVFVNDWSKYISMPNLSNTTKPLCVDLVPESVDYGSCTIPQLHNQKWE